MSLFQPMGPEYYINRLSRSLDRSKERIQRYLDRKRKEGKEGDPDVSAMVEFMQSEEEQRLDRESKPEWHCNNLEADLRSTDWILAKARERESYAQNLYAALCNNTFQKMDVVTILKDETWSCSWRYAGGIIADMRQSGDYLDWYCSGIRDFNYPDLEVREDWTPEQHQRWNDVYQYYVGESVVTDEVREDLRRLGWQVIDTGDE